MNGWNRARAGAPAREPGTFGGACAGQLRAVDEPRLQASAIVDAFNFHDFLKFRVERNNVILPMKGGDVRLTWQSKNGRLGERQPG